MTSAPTVAKRGGDDANQATRDDAKQRGVSASVEPTIAQLERAIVAATLGGRLAVAELLADRLRVRLTAESNAVMKLARIKRYVDEPT